MPGAGHLRGCRGSAGARAPHHRGRCHGRASRTRDRAPEAHGVPDDGSGPAPCPGAGELRRSVRPRVRTATSAAWVPCWGSSSVGRCRSSERHRGSRSPGRARPRPSSGPRGAAADALGGAGPLRPAARRVRPVVRDHGASPVSGALGRCAARRGRRPEDLLRPEGRTAGPARTRNATTDEAYTLRPGRARTGGACGRGMGTRGPHPPRIAVGHPRAAGAGMVNTGGLAYGGSRSSTRPFPVTAAHQEIPDRRPCALVPRAPPGAPPHGPSFPDERAAGPGTAAFPALRPAP